MLNNKCNNTMTVFSVKCLDFSQEISRYNGYIISVRIEDFVCQNNFLVNKLKLRNHTICIWYSDLKNGTLVNLERSTSNQKTFNKPNNTHCCKTNKSHGFSLNSSR